MTKKQLFVRLSKFDDNATVKVYSVDSEEYMVIIDVEISCEEPDNESLQENAALIID